MALKDVDSYLAYIKDKAGDETGIKNKKAHTNGDGKSIILPYHYKMGAIVLPAKEADGTTNTNQNIVFYNYLRMRIPVTYTGKANA